MKQMILCLLVVAFAALSAFAQTITYKVGDTVQTPDGRRGKIESFKPMSDLAKVQFEDGSTKYFVYTTLKVIQPPKPVLTEPLENFRVGDIVIRESNPNQQLRIDSISGDSAIVRYGVGRYNTYSIKLEELMSLKTWERKQAQENEGKIVRAEFEDDARQFENTVIDLARAYNPKFDGLSADLHTDPKVYAKFQKELESLHAVCQKYPNLTNPPHASSDPSNIRLHPADWCKMADERTAVLQKAKTMAGDFYAKHEIDRWTLKVNEAIRQPDGYVTDEVQTLLFDRVAWEQKNLPELKKYYFGASANVPPELFKALEEKIAELKAQIEAETPSRSWEQPNFKDAASEAAARREIPTDLPGARILKTGMLDTTWKVRDKSTYTGSDGTFKFYRITPGAYRFKLGRALVRLPNRPFCQIREFSVTQYKAGAGYGAARASSSDAGRFVKCQ